jgi:hypothetical protein
MSSPCRVICGATVPEQYRKPRLDIMWFEN